MNTTTLAKDIDSFVEFQVSRDFRIMCEDSNLSTLNENGAKLLHNYLIIHPVAMRNLMEVVGSKDIMRFGYLVRQYRNNWAWRL